MLKTHNYPVF